MSHISADDLERIANYLNQIAQKYMDGSEQLDQLVRLLDGTTSQVLSSGTYQWKGISSEAFYSAWLQRRARMQQVLQLLMQCAQHLSQFARTIEDHSPTIRRDQSQEDATKNSQIPSDLQSILEDELQAQEQIESALSGLNSFLEAQIEAVGDCPEEQKQVSSPDPVDNFAQVLDLAKDELSVFKSELERLKELVDPKKEGGGSIDESKRKFSPRERRLAEKLKSEGKHVEALEEGTVLGQRSGDALVDGIQTEFKTPDPGADSATIRNEINESIKRGGQARNIIIDARGSGLTKAEAQRGLARAKNITRGRIDSVRIIGDGFDIPSTDFQ